MKFARIPALVCLLVLSLPAFACQAADGDKPTAAPEASKGPNFVPIDSLIQEQVNDEGITGAVLAVGHNGRIIHQKAFGYRALSPRREPMTVDTVFDLASLTKVVATTPSVLHLMQSGRLRLDDAVARYIPEFGANGKENVTIRQLLTHFSGLKPDLDLNPPWAGEETAFRMANEEKLQTPPGAQFVYSDINFIVLGELVQRLSGLPLDRYAVANVFEPLGMKHTRFLPPPVWHSQIAETLSIGNREILRGKVQDPTAQRMGGVAGDAGLFSTAGDLALYAQALIDRKKILSPDLIEKMTTPQQPPNAVEVRGLGWDIDSPFSSNRGALLPVGSFGHTGYTGTSIWIDPYTNTYIILLTNSVRPRSASVPVISLRGRVATAVAAALNLDVTSSARDRLFSITGYNEVAPAARRIGPRNGSVLTGIDVLEKDNFAALKSGKQQACCATDSPSAGERVLNIGLVTNQ
ncbi:MAG TPA: serine hydrolase domain-containing protein, partial [Candidatus Angelobacter sp.]|nr:serine hydrolase domain-containing protein [Candidatus Angelobacter sp.]